MSDFKYYNDLLQPSEIFIYYYLFFINCVLKKCVKNSKKILKKLRLQKLKKIVLKKFMLKIIPH